MTIAVGFDSASGSPSEAALPASGFALAEPEAPDDIDGGVGDRGGQHLSLRAPSPAVKDSGDRGQQNVPPIECRTFMEVRKAKEHGSHGKSGDLAKAGFQQILENAPEEEFLGHGGQQKGNQHSRSLLAAAPRAFRRAGW